MVLLMLTQDGWGQKETVEDKWGFINVNVRQLRKKEMILLTLMQDDWGQQETAEGQIRVY